MASTPSAANAAAPANPRLPFTALDEAVHLLDTPSEPWTIQLEAQIDGRLDAERLRRALREGLSRHDMARARRLPARRTDRHYTWELTADLDLDALRVVDCINDAALADVRAEFYSVAVPLSESPPLRLLLAHSSTGDVVMVSANHAAFDGFGTLRLLDSVARAYAGRSDPEPSVRLAEARDLDSHLTAADRSTRARRWGVIAAKAADLLRPPARLGADHRQERTGYGFHHLERDVPPAGEEATVNDVLLTALNLAIDGWNAEHGVRDRRISVLMPVNLRPDEWKTDMVTNFVAETRILTRGSERTTPKRTLEAVVGQTRRMKEGDSAALWEFLRLSYKLPLWAKQPLSFLLWLTGNRLVDTAVFSNLGRIEDPPSFAEAGGGVTGLWFSAPARMPCGLSVGAVTLGDRLFLSFRYRHALWGPDAAARFAERFGVELDLLVREAVLHPRAARAGKDSE